MLRGPQGTLFGKNTTAGAINITTNAPAFAFGATVETRFGGIGYWQAKATVTGPVWGDVAPAACRCSAPGATGSCAI